MKGNTPNDKNEDHDEKKQESSRKKRQNHAQNYRSITTQQPRSMLVEERNLNNIKSNAIERGGANQINPEKYIVEVGPTEKPKLIVEEQKSESTSQLKIPSWTEEVDRFTNFKVQNLTSAKEVMEKMEYILKELDSSKVRDAISPRTLAFELEENRFWCKLTIDDFRNCEFSVGVYTFEKDAFLLDVQELYGEHFTFSDFLTDFKNKLRDLKIADIPKPSQDFLDNYGLDLDIDLDVF